MRQPRQQRGHRVADGVYPATSDSALEWENTVGMMDPWSEVVDQKRDYQSEASGTSGAPSSRDCLDLFGLPRLRYANGTVSEPLEWQKPVALLAYLCCRPGWHSREALAEILRPEASQSAGRAYVRGLLHRTREIFPRLEALQFEEGRGRWCGMSDVQEFEQAMAHGDWLRAISLQSEPLLGSAGSTGEPSLDDWFREERIRLRQRLGTALISSIVQPRSADLDGREKLMQQLVDLDPLDESAVQVLLSHASSPVERHTAVAAYRTLKRRLGVEFGQQPLEGTQELFAILQASGPPSPPSAESSRRARVPRGPLSAPTPLGRERELQELQGLLADPSVRLLTVHGPGGVGKTSVAQALFAASAEAGCPAVWVDLLGIDTAHGLMAAIALNSMMTLHDGAVEEQVTRWLAARELVVYLDNFEQLAGNAHMLERMLRASPKLRFVVTSREALGLPQEHVYALGGLPCAGPDSAAARLFATNAARIGRPVGPAEEAAVGELVRYLEGLPLAIELAANWVSVLPVDAVLAELRRNPAFLDEGQDGRATRTMRSVFEGMWKRLDAKEQDALLSLSVVMGQIDLQTIGAGAYGQAGVFLRLVRKSLLQRMEMGLFRMHPLLRAFVQARCGPEALDDARRRHAERFVAALVGLPALRVDRHLPEVVARIQPYTEDLAQAWRFAAERGRWELLEVALPNLGGYLLMVSRHELLLELVADAERRLPGEHPLRADLTVCHALASFRLGRMGEAESTARAALGRDSVAPPARALLHSVVSRVQRFHGDYPRALLEAEQALACLREEDDPFARLQVVEALALCHWNFGQLAEAERWLSQNLMQATREDARCAEATALCVLGILRDAMGRPQEGLELLVSGEKLFREMDDPYRAAYCQRAMSYVHLNLGDVRHQANMAEAALATFREPGYEHEVPESIFAVAVARAAAGRAQEAVDLCRDALRRSMQIGQLPIALRCVGELGAVYALEDRAGGLAVMCFAANHPSLRRTDLALIERRFGELRARADELVRAREQARTWTTEAVCSRLLDSSPRAAISAGGEPPN